MEEWKVQRTSSKCFGTERELAAGEEYYAALVETESGFDRIDYSSEYWQEHKPEVFCYWKSRVPVKEEKTRLLVDNDILQNVFVRLEGETDARKINFRFVLCLILMRKKILRYETSELVDGQEVWKMKQVKNPNLVDVINPHLDDEKIKEVSQELGPILNGDFD